MIDVTRSSFQRDPRLPVVHIDLFFPALRNEHLATQADNSTAYPNSVRLRPCFNRGPRGNESESPSPTHRKCGSTNIRIGMTREGKSVRDEREPVIPGESVLPAMRILQAVQDQWDERHGA